MPTTGITITVTAETVQAAAALQRFTNDTLASLNRLTGAGALLSRLGGQLAAAFSVERLIAFTRDAINLQDQAGKMAQALGLSAESFSALAYAAKLANVEQGEFGIAMRSLNRQLAALVAGNTEAARSFDALGLTGRIVSEGLRDTDAVLLAIAERFKTLPDDFNKTALATNLFGRAGERLIPLLNQGSAGIQAAREEASRFGVVVSGEAARAAADFKDNLTRLQSSLTGIFVTFSQEILPVLNSFIKAMTEASEQTEKAYGPMWALAGAIKILAGGFTVIMLALEVIGKELANLVAFPVNIATSGFTAALDAYNEHVLAIMDRIDEVKVRLADIFAPQPRPRPAPTPPPDLGAELATIIAAREKLRAAQAQHNLRILVADQRVELAQLEERYRQELIGLDAFLAEKRRLVTEAAEAERETIGAEMDRLNARRAAATEAERIELQAQFEPLGAALRESEKKLQLDLLEIDREGAAKRLEALRQLDARRALQLAQVSAAARGIEQSADLDRVEKKRELTDLLQVETWLLERNIEINRQRATDESLTTETRLEAERNLLSLEQQRVQVLLQLRDLQVQESFFGQMSRGLIELSDAWSNLGANLAGGVLDGIRLAVQGVTQAIMGAIAGTRTWGEVFAAVGRQIISSLINIVIQWIVNMTLLRLLKKIFQTEENVQAAKAAAAWAPAAIAASTASYGAAAAVGLASFLAAVGTGTGIAAGLSSAAGASSFAAGGYTGAGPTSEPAGIVHREEFVFSAPAVECLGLPALEALHSGSVPAQAAKQNIANVSVAMIDPTSASVRQWMESAEGEKIVVDLVRKRRLDIGINT